MAFILHFGGSKLLDYNSRSNNGQTRFKTAMLNTLAWLQLFNEANNHVLNIQPNIFEGMSKNWFFLGMKTSMIGGQVLAIVKGGRASRNTALNGKELGLSAGFDAMSLPMGVAIQLFLEWFVHNSDTTPPTRMMAWRGVARYWGKLRSRESWKQSSRQVGLELRRLTKTQAPDGDPDIGTTPLREQCTMRRNEASMTSDQNRRSFGGKVHDLKARRTKASGDII
ncbi:plasma membrane calcium [Ceratocystis pirilliformis]|uniref:Plasma membrane calcium n=1 Tax=Ceratocystis pirilliformis TaxID=259994 RepID=A0ABR3YYK1_9PEZI